MDHGSCWRGSIDRAGLPSMGTTGYISTLRVRADRNHQRATAHGDFQREGVKIERKTTV